MKKKTRHIRKYPKKWSKERARFENRKRDHTPKKIRLKPKKEEKINDRT